MLDSKIISDETRIQDKSWTDLKVAAMKKNYSHPFFYTVEDKIIMSELIKAQKSQGDMKPLQPQVYNNGSKFCPGKLLKDRIID